jgi:hypothetical protein
VGVGGFLGMILLQCVPILNIILLFKWSFGRTVNLNRKNLARAILILWILSILIFVGGFALLGETLLPLITQM